MWEVPLYLLINILSHTTTHLKIWSARKHITHFEVTKNIYIWRALKHIYSL